MSPTTSRGKSGKRYRYYVSAPLQQGKRPADRGGVKRLSATKIERVVSDAVGRWAPTPDNPFAIIRSVCLSDRGLQISIEAAQVAKVALRLADGEMILDRTADSVTVQLPIHFVSRGGKHRIVPSGHRPPQPDLVLITALRRAHAMIRAERGMPVVETAPTSPYDRNILRLAFLAPSIQRAILDGRQPLHLNLETLKKTTIPLAWTEQRRALGFGGPGIPCSGKQIP